MSQYDHKLITPDQIRAARALLNWSAQRLAEETKLGVATVRRAERGKAPLTITAANAEAIVRALEHAGIQFLPNNGGGPGARWAKPSG